MGTGRAFLWVPPSSARVRAVVVGQNNMIEEGILEHRAFRATLSELGIAEVFVAPPFDHVFNFSTGAGDRFESMMRALAEVSGYEELASAPVVPIGHSACASYPWNFAAWNPGRTLAILSVKGDAPQTDLTGSGKPNPEWGDRRIDGIPGLMVMSEYEWWDARLVPALQFRANHPKVPIALLADVGHGHFDALDPLVEFLADFIRHAAAARLSEDPYVPLRAVDPASGWLVDRWRGDEPLRAPAAPTASYTGDRAEAFWCFARAMARATEAYYTTSRSRRRQQVDFQIAGALAPISTTHAGVELTAALEPDGVTFRLGAEFIAPLPPKVPIAAKDKAPPPKVVTPERAPAGTHAAGFVQIACITGPVLQVGPNLFRVQLNRAAPTTQGRASDIWLLAWHPGDTEYKATVQQALVHLPSNPATAEQHLSFPRIESLSRGETSLRLTATSDAGLPVYYYVREGPAELDGDVIRLTAIPVRAKRPMSVTVVAWQPGVIGAAGVKAAAPIEQSFTIAP